MPYSVEIWLIVSEKVNDVAENNEQNLEQWVRLRELRHNKKQAARAEKEAGQAEKEAARAERAKKQLAKLEILHPELCEITHPRTTHAKWGSMVNRWGIKFKSTYTTVNCLNCKEKIPVRGKSWVMSKNSKNTSSRGSRGTRTKIKIHFCKRCGISPEDVRQVRTAKKIVKPPSPSYFQSPSRVRLYSGQRKK